MKPTDMLSKKFKNISALSYFTPGLGSGKMLQQTKCMWFCYSLHFFLRLPVERLDVMIECMHFSGKSKKNIFTGHQSMMTKIRPAVQLLIRHVYTHTYVCTFMNAENM
jgi:hypothetical protein